MPRIFLSYARGDDELFVKRLHADLTAAGFTVWFDRESLMSRGLTFHHEIKDAIRTEVDRIVYVGGPKAALSAYVREEWQFALECDHVVVTPIRRIGDMENVPGELGLLHCVDFRDDAHYPAALAKLIDYLRQPNPKLGALFAVPSLPPHFLGRPDLMRRVRDALLVDLQKPQVITSADAKVGMQGMGGIGKSVLAAALASKGPANIADIMTRLALATVHLRNLTEILEAETNSVGSALERLKKVEEEATNVESKVALLSQELASQRQASDRHRKDIAVGLGRLPLVQKHLESEDSALRTSVTGATKQIADFNKLLGN